MGRDTGVSEAWNYLKGTAYFCGYELTFMAFINGAQPI